MDEREGAREKKEEESESESERERGREYPVPDDIGIRTLSSSFFLSLHRAYSYACIHYVLYPTSSHVRMGGAGRVYTGALATSVA